MPTGEIAVILKKILEAGKVGYILSSKMHCIKEETINPLETKTVLDLSGVGVVDQVLVRSPTKDIKIIVEVDGSEAIGSTYDELREIEQDARDIAAFEELDENGYPTGYYVVSIKDVWFKSSVKIFVRNIGSQSIVLPNVFVKYRIGGG